MPSGRRLVEPGAIRSPRELRRSGRANAELPGRRLGGRGACV